MLSQRALRPIALFAAIELFIVGGVGAWLAARLHFPYAYLTPISLIVYGGAGFYGCRAGAAGWASGAIVAFLDAATWAAFGGVGPQPTDPQASVAVKVVTVGFAVGLGALCGWVGARFSRRGSAPSSGVAA